jgi:predicted ATPase
MFHHFDECISMSGINTLEDPEGFISLLRQTALLKNGLSLSNEESIQIDIIA